MDDKQCEHVGRAVAEASWLAHQLHLLYRDHPNTAGALFRSIPEGPYRPLENLRLTRPDADRTSWGDHWPDELTLQGLAQRAGQDASNAELDAFQIAWRDGRGVAAQELASKARGGLSRPLRLFHAACTALLGHAVLRCREKDTVDARLDRSLMLARFGHHDDALATLAQALEHADAAQQARIHQARALILEADLAASLDALDAALEHSSDLETSCQLRHQRGTIHLSAAHLLLAIDDFTFAAERSQIAQISQSALLARALAHTKTGNDAAATADYGRVIARESETPRLAVMARQDRGRIYADQGRNGEALADWAAALKMADATEEQRFRILERRKDVFERIGETARAASDYEAMATYRSVTREYRDELRAKAAELRARR